MRELDVLVGGFILNILNLFSIFRFGRKIPVPTRDEVKTYL